MSVNPRHWEIVDPRRFRRPGKRIEWRCSLRVRMRFRGLLQELVDLETYPQTRENLMRMENLREEIRSLPNFPKRYNAERDLIVPVTSSVQR
jgi:hypothetical protein